MVIPEPNCAYETIIASGHSRYFTTVCNQYLFPNRTFVVVSDESFVV